MVWQCLNINTARRLPAASSSLKIDGFSDTHSTHCRVKLFASTNRHQTLLKNIQIRRHFFILLHMPNLLLPILKHQNVTQQSPPFIQCHQSTIPDSTHHTSLPPFPNRNPPSHTSPSTSIPPHLRPPKHSPIQPFPPTPPMRLMQPRRIILARLFRRVVFRRSSRFDRGGV